ncbi:MAG: MASE1 domain-containing protein [Candidatus Marsarchaeota archaeon]|jgi:hypothetical protein|nr:MASE1 domain-containing protein [Candidatus Marsarchaeota archaeon]MCL5115090.1 MASE1 domain-containing protein [Candidatus Marsarchaeota archaeon]
MAVRYTLQWRSGKKNTPLQYGIYAIQILIIIGLSWLGVVFTPFSYAGVGLFYWAEAFIILFTLWWGLWGMISTYVGTVIGAGILTHLPLGTSLLFALGDLIPVLLAFVIYRNYSAKHSVSPFGSDILGNTRALGLFFLWLVVITNILGGIIGVGMLVLTGSLHAYEYLPASIAWVAGDAIMLLIFLPPTSKFLTPILERHHLLTEGLVS